MRVRSFSRVGWSRLLTTSWSSTERATCCCGSRDPEGDDVEDHDGAQDDGDAKPGCPGKNGAHYSIPSGPSTAPLMNCCVKGLVERCNSSLDPCSTTFPPCNKMMWSPMLKHDLMS